MVLAVKKVPKLLVHWSYPKDSQVITASTYFRPVNNTSGLKQHSHGFSSEHALKHRLWFAVCSERGEGLRQASQSVCDDWAASVATEAKTR